MPLKPTLAWRKYLLKWELLSTSVRDWLKLAKPPRRFSERDKGARGWGTRNDKAEQVLGCRTSLFELESCGLR